MNIRFIPWTLELKGELVSICNAVDRSYLSDRMPFPYMIQDAVSWLGYVADSQKNGTGIFRAIEVDGEIVGAVSVERKGDICKIDGELGYYLLSDYWNKGIMTRVISEFVPLCFETLDIVRITAHVLAPNVASAKVLAHNGFSHEGTLRNGAIKNDKIYDLMIWGIVN